MFKSRYCGSLDNAKRKSTLIAIGVAEIAIGLLEIGFGMHGAHVLVGVGTSFIALGIIFLCRARQMSTP